MGYSLDISPSVEVPQGLTLAWSVRLSVLSDDPLQYPPKCLVFQAETLGDPDSRAWFTAVASPAQLQEYPEDEPATADSGEAQVPYFRLDEVQLISRSPADIQTLIESFTEELSLLQRNLDALDVLGEPQTIVIP